MSDTTLSTTVEHVGTVTVLAVTGDIDLATAPILRTALTETIAAGATALVVDLSNVGFIASVGISVLVAARERLDPVSRFATVANTPAVRRPFQVLGFDGMLELHENLLAAIAALTA